jgi:hypothetical protein
MKLSQYYKRATASIEAAAMNEIRQELKTGEFSDMAMGIESAQNEQASLAYATLESLASARQLDTASSELTEVYTQAQEVREGIAGINAMGGFTLESYQWAQRAVATVLSDVMTQYPPLVGSVEAFNDGKVQLSLESLDDVIARIGEARADVEAKSVDGILRVINVLKDALPEIKDRMHSLRLSLPDAVYDEEKQIRLDSVIYKALAVNGQVPTGMKDYLTGYGIFANRMLAQYAENAMDSASKTPQMAEAMASCGDGDVFEAILKVYNEIGDPRRGIAADQLCFVLPGSGPLFGNKVDPNVMVDDAPAAPPVAVAKADAKTDKPVDDEAAAPAADKKENPFAKKDDKADADDKAAAKADDKAAAKADEESEEDENASQESMSNTVDDDRAAAQDLQSRMETYSTSHAPLDPLSYGERGEPAGTAPTMRVLSKETILSGLSELIKAIEGVDINSFAEARQQTWVAARSAFSAYQQSLMSLSPRQASKLRPINAAIAEYLDTVFALSTWPVLHLLTNFVFTSNAFVLLAERSIAGKSDEAPTATPEDDGDLEDNGVAAEEGDSVIDGGRVMVVPADEQGGDADQAVKGDTAVIIDGKETPAVIEPTPGSDAVVTAAVPGAPEGEVAVDDKSAGVKAADANAEVPADPDVTSALPDTEPPAADEVEALPTADTDTPTPVAADADANAAQADVDADVAEDAAAKGDTAPPVADTAPVADVPAATEPVAPVADTPVTSEGDGDNAAPAGDDGVIEQTDDQQPPHGDEITDEEKAELERLKNAKP